MSAPTLSSSALNETSHHREEKVATMQIANLYRPGLLTCGMNESVAGVAKKMLAKHVGALAVVDGATIVGVISERDVVRAVAGGADPTTLKAFQYLSASVRTAKTTDDTHEVARHMLDAGVRHLPVVGDEGVVGMVSIRDLLAVETWA
jgi:CBS domain-containing protein